MKDALGIAVVCYPSLGGSGVIAAELAIGMAERGHRVHVIATAPPSRSLPEHERLLFHQVTVPDYPLFEYPPFELALAAKIEAVAQLHRLDIVHVHYAVPHAVSAYLARQALGAAAPRVITTLHGTDVTGIGADPHYRAITRLAVAACDGLTAPSEYLRRAAARSFELGHDHVVRVIPNFVDSERFVPAEQRDPTRWDDVFGRAGNRPAPTLFHVSNFRPVKRVGDLFEVLARLRRQLPARLILVGDGPERQAAEQHARALGLAEAVRFLGRRTDFESDLRHADVFVLPSESESFGVAALEALSSGVPVFGYRVGGLPEVVNDEVGRLVEPLSVDALADAVLVALADSSYRDRLGRAARQHVLANFRRQPALDKYEGYYREVLG